MRDFVGYLWAVFLEYTWLKNVRVFAGYARLKRARLVSNVYDFFGLARLKTCAAFVVCARLNERGFVE